VIDDDEHPIPAAPTGVSASAMQAGERFKQEQLRQLQEREQANGQVETSTFRP
jgi:hypothetical protein